MASCSRQERRTDEEEEEGGDDADDVSREKENETEADGAGPRQ